MKKSIFYYCLAACFLSATFFGGYAQTGRTVSLFNNDWKFHKGDVVNGETVGLDDRDWRTLSLPHDWSIEGPFSEEWASGTAFLPAGIGWYRKTFILPGAAAPTASASPAAAAGNKKFFIYFDGVYKNSEVWINGHYLGKRPNGFISFQYELTPYLKIGAANVLAVRVDHSQFGDSRWYTGSGIYRNVYLISTAPLHIGQWGVQFSTPEVSSRRALVKAKVDLVNGMAKDEDAGLTCRLVNAAGETVARADKKIFMRRGDSNTTSLEFAVRDPRLWSVDHPALYELVLSLTSGDGGGGGGRIIDEWRQKVGIRNIRFDADSGFFLNGANMKLKGVCLHDDAGALGVAVPKEVWFRRLKWLKEAGCNSIRMSHNPHASYLYDLCDEMGFLVMDEAFDEWEQGKNKWIKGWNAGEPGKDGYHEYFKDWFDRDLRDMVLRDRNHPAIIMWSIGNEIDYPNDPYSDTILNTGRNPQIYGKGFLPDHPPARRLGELSQLLAAVVKKADSSRPVTAALAGVVMSNTTDFPGNLDIVGYNYQEYRYQDDHMTYPHRVIYGSENGMQAGVWMAVDSNIYIAGQYLWTGIDYLGEARKWPSRSSGSGLLDLAGFPKPEYYFRQSLWSDRPMIYLSTEMAPDPAKKEPSRDRMQVNAGWNFKIGDRVRVNCFTNGKESELFLNGRSLGKKFLSQFPDRVMYWDVDYQPGELTVKGEAGDGGDGKKISYGLRTSGEAYGVTVRNDMSGMPDRPSGHGRRKLLQLVIQVVDKNGFPVCDADNEINLTIEGPAKLLGLESGSLNSHEDYRSTSRQALHGRLLAFVQPDAEPGLIRVVLRSKGLKTQTWQLNP